MKGKAMNHGRTISGKRGIGSGSDSYKTSTKSPGSIKGFKKTKGDGKGSKKGGKGY